MVMLFQYLYGAAAVIAWFHIVFMGRTSGGIHNSLTVGLAYQLRAIAYLLLVTETIPPISDQEPAANATPLPALAPAAAKPKTRTTKMTAGRPEGEACGRSRRTEACGRGPPPQPAAAKKPATGASRPAASLAR
jgi:hypothetical protein